MDTGIRLHPVGSSVVGALGCPVWALVTSQSASLDGAAVIGREVVLRTKGEPGGGCGQAVRGDMSPPTASSTKSVWPQGLLEGADLVPASEQSDSTLAEAAVGRLAENRGHNRRRAVPARLEAGPNLGPAQPPDLSWDVHPAIFRLELPPELQQTTVSRPSHIPSEGDAVDPDPPPLLLGDNVSDAVVLRPDRLQHQIPVLEEALQGKVGGGGAKDSAGIHAPDLLDSDAAGALFVEGLVDQGHNVLDLVTGQLRFKLGCVCVVFYFLYRCPRGQQPIFPPPTESCPQLHTSQTGAPPSPSPHDPKKRATKKKPEQSNKTKQNNRLIEPPRPPYSSISSELGSIPVPASISPTPPSPWAAGASFLGAPGAVAPLSLRGWGGDLHPLADRRASLLAAQASARAPWDSPQFAHLAGTGRPYPPCTPRLGIGGRS